MSYMLDRLCHAGSATYQKCGVCGCKVFDISIKITYCQMKHLDIRNINDIISLTDKIFSCPGDAYDQEK